MIATLAGGCFWCTEAIFRRLKGVEKVTPGYSDHVEAIQFTFDQKIIPYEKLLEIFFHLHDPTRIQQPGTLDTGPEYRSAIFYHDEAQKKVALKMKSEIPKAITEIVPFMTFYPADESHREYYEKNSYQPYCQVIIDPKIQKLMSEYRADVKPEYV